MPNTPTPRAAIYARVSDSSGGRSRSVAEQLTEGRGVRERNGWSGAGDYQDDDRGASRWSRGDRPDWQRLLADIDARALDILIVWELSRSTRDRRVWAALVEACMDAGVQLCVGGRLHDLSDPDDAVALDIGAALSVRESAVTRKRVLRALASNAAAGRPHGRVSYGWRRVYDERTGVLERTDLDEVEAGAVQDMARRAMAHQSLASIARGLNERGVPSARGAEWTPNTVKVMLLRPANVGLRVHRGQIVGEADWPPILERADWLALRDLLDRPSKGRPGSVRYLCTSSADGPAVRCAVCGSGLRAKTLRPGTPMAYVCVGAYCVAAPVDEVDRVVTAYVITRLSRPDAAELFRRVDHTEVATAEAEAARLQTQLDGFVDAAADGQLSPGALARIEQRLQPKIDAARAVAAVAGVPTALLDLVNADDVTAAWEAMTLQARRAVLEVLGPFGLRRSAPGTQRRGRVFDDTRVVLPGEWPDGGPAGVSL